jgi:uncharacterized protein YkwD
MKKLRFAVLLLPFLLLRISYARSDLVAYLTVTNPNTEVNRAGTNLWVQLNAESIVGVGDTIRTDATGQAILSMFGQTSTVQFTPNTEIQILQLQRDEEGYVISLQLNRGISIQNFNPPSDGSASYEVKTSKMNTVAQQGRFMLAIEGDAAKMLVQSGSAFGVAGGTVTEVPANSGIRTQDNGQLSDIVPAATFEQLDSALDGVPATFASDADILLNVRQGPARSNAALGSVAPADIQKILGVSRDHNWYRIPFGDHGAGWVSAAAATVTADTSNLLVFANDYVEQPPNATASEPAASEPTPAEGAAAPAETSSISAILNDYNMTELDLLSKLNDWRIREGLWPFALNPILTHMAHDQANYILSFPTLPGDLHIDARGRYPRERAVSSDYQWPYYGTPARVAVGENAYAGASTNAAIRWWDQSQMHHDTIVNPAYREIGIAAVPHPMGTLFVVVFGSRPDVFPALVDPTTNTLYLSSERFRYATPDKWMVNISKFEFLPNVLTQIDDNAWADWALKTSAPAGTSPFTIVYKGDNNVIMSEVNPQADIAWLPSNLSLLQTSSAPNSSSGN